MGDLQHSNPFSIYMVQEFLNLPEQAPIYREGEHHGAKLAHYMVPLVHFYPCLISQDGKHHIFEIGLYLRSQRHGHI